ncbi:MAG TPA: peroxidase-related enzyme [Tahibacter sp.]|nr:peroxidase-related enzyme [Tahibacter sp.]
MSYIPVADRNTLDAATNATLDGVNAKLGTIPNLFLTLAHTPVALNAYQQLAALTAGGKLKPRQREFIALAVGEANDCTYCVAAHGAIAKRLGVKPEQIDLARDGRAEDPHDAAVLALARRIVETRGKVPTADLDAFKAAGFGDGDILEVLVNVAQNIFSNYANHIARTEVDFPVLARHAA